MVCGRRVAIRMTIVAMFVAVAAVLAALAYRDLEFVFFGVVGVVGCGLSSLAAIATPTRTAVTIGKADDEPGELDK